MYVCTYFEQGMKDIGNCSVCCKEDIHLIITSRSGIIVNWKMHVCVNLLAKNFFVLLGILQKFNTCERLTRRSCEDLAAFEAITFIALYGKQPLEKNWHMKGSPTTHKIVML